MISVGLNLFMKVLLLQLFWLSYALIGYSVVRLFSWLAAQKNIRIIEPVVQTHTIVKIFIYFAIGLVSMLPITLISFMFRLPILFSSGFYLVLLVSSIYLAFRDNRSNISKLYIRNNRMLGKNFWLIVAILALAFIGYIMLVIVGAELTGDVKFELAQITLFSSEKVSLVDPIFGDNGVPPTVYSLSILHLIYAVATNIFNESAGWVWYYSAAFFKVIFLVSLFGLGWEYLNNKVRRTISYSFLFVLPFILDSGRLQTLQLHNQVVIIWTALFILGVKYWLDKRNGLLLLVSSILIACTHPLNSFMAACFLTLLTIALIGLRTIKKRDMLIALGSITILLLPLMLYFYFPHGITEAGFNDGPLSGVGIRLGGVGALLFNTNIPIPDFTQLLLIFCLILLFQLGNRIKNRNLKLAYTLPIIFSVILISPLYIIGLLGTGYLFLNTDSKQDKITIFLLAIFTALFSYNPILLTAFEGNLPLWVFARFADFNPLVFITPIIGIYFIVWEPLKRINIKHQIAFSMVLISLLALYLNPMIATKFNNPFSSRSYTANRSTFSKREKLLNLKPHLERQLVFSDDYDLLADLPSVVSTDVFLIDNETNINPAVFIKERKLCGVHLLSNLNSQDLKMAGITRVITSPYSTPYFKRLTLEQKLILLKEHEGYKVYSVPITKKQNPRSNICLIPTN